MEKSIRIEKASECCGCRNCENICPKSAIKMVENEEGFSYPKVDEEKCINCGLCKKVCPWLNDIPRNEKYLEKPISYAAKTNNIDIQKKSSSGGIFATLANEILDKNGIVFGCTLDEELKAKHISVKNKNDLYKIMGSKYISSDLGNIFIEVKEHLEKDEYVLFSGVPCQISGLFEFLQKDYEKLITVEVICHGVPSQKLFSKYIKHLENKYDSKIVKYDFRNKEAASWGTFKSLVKFEKNDKKTVKKLNADFDPYYWSFLYSKNYRESCYECKFAQKERNADFTLGDFWGIEHILPEMIDYNGVSIMVLNTKKAVEFFEKIEKEFTYRDVDYEKICEYNKQLQKPSPRPAERDEWYKNIDDENFIGQIKVKKNIKSYIKIFTPEKIKFTIKKFIK